VLLCAAFAAAWPAVTRPLAAQAHFAAEASVAEGSAPPPLPREFRGAWVASVANIDWPSRPGLGTAEQQAELLQILDRAVDVGLNAVILQVRPGADALYESRYEPWSEYLTGQMGRAPEPRWDPLAFAVQEAHARGLELHAWFNPFRARHADAATPASRDHVSRTHPELVRKYGKYLWMDPGEPAVQARSLRVITDVVRRYDVDGIHIDDYFYPYRESNGRGGYLPFPDDQSWRRYRRGGGTLARDDWRRRNVDTFVRRVYEGVKAEKPWVKFGISPFGIWRPGYPAQIRGLDSYREIFADSRKWLANGWVDYFVPQLYWRVGQSAQSYPVLLQWWVEQNAKGRHIWAGNYTSRSGGLASPAWTSSELLDQIRLTRAQSGATGNVHFSMKALMPRPMATMSAEMVAAATRTPELTAAVRAMDVLGWAAPSSPPSPALPVMLGEQLRMSSYAEPALVPASPWLSDARPAKPVATVERDPVTGGLVLRLRPGSARVVRFWVVRTRAGGEWSTAVVPESARSRALAKGAEAAPDAVVVTAVDRYGNESDATAVRYVPER